jgi:selenide,water dikinase
MLGIADADDAGVYRINDELAIIQTLDFITPIVDDPYDFGRIAAANSLSDVWAMGGRPITVMNIVCFPQGKLEISVLRKILDGALKSVEQSGAVMLGGHSVKDEELKYGLSVTGVVHPDKVIMKSGAKAGDKLILTKPLGTGIINTAYKAKMLKEEDKKALVKQMAQLNKEASEIMVEGGAHACTDITGFGLVGHASEMAESSGVNFKLKGEAIPLMKDAAKWAVQGMIPAGLYDNRDFRKDKVKLASGLPEALKDIIYDPQTSGGLLIAMPPGQATETLAQLKEAGYSQAALIGEVAEEEALRIIVE